MTIIWVIIFKKQSAVLQTLGVRNGPVACTKACEQDNPESRLCVILINMSLHYHGMWTPKTCKYH